tara:strand:- start:462 stop:1055 length:594 start_codon:yes stop_codon:yes gene_type:complete
MDNNKILRYVEGQLTDQDKKDFEALIESDSELQLEVEMLSNLIDNEPDQMPPYQLRQKIYEMVGIKDPSFMEIAIKRADKILDIILGKEYSLDIKPAFITRSGEESMLFSKKMDDCNILCDICPNQDGIYIMNLAASSANKEINNIKFAIIQNKKNIMEKYTNSTGNTGSFIIDSGVYYINISNTKSEIGNIKINLS